MKFVYYNYMYLTCPRLTKPLYYSRYHGSLFLRHKLKLKYFALKRYAFQLFT